MKTMLLLGAASSLVFAFAPTTAFAQADPSITSTAMALTCRSALQGGQFSQVLDIASPPCCYVSIEEDWYKANGIRISSIYQRSDGGAYRAERCDVVSDRGMPVDPTTTGGIGASVGPVAVQPTGAGGTLPAANTGVQPSSGAGVVLAGRTSARNTGGHSGGDGDNGHGNDQGGFDPSNTGNSTGTHRGNGGNGNQDAGNDLPNNPGNVRPVGRAGEAPNGDVQGFQPDPGTRGRSN